MHEKTAVCAPGHRPLGDWICLSLDLDVPASIAGTNKSLLFIHHSFCGSLCQLPQWLTTQDSRKWQLQDINTYPSLGLPPQPCGLQRPTLMCSMISVSTKLGNYHHPTTGGFSATVPTDAPVPLPFISLVSRKKSPRFKMQF